LLSLQSHSFRGTGFLWPYSLGFLGLSFVCGRCCGFILVSVWLNMGNLENIKCGGQWRELLAGVLVYLVV
jgi:hypothetical protein